MRPTQVDVTDARAIQMEQEAASLAPLSNDAMITPDAFAGFEIAGTESNQEPPPVAVGWARELNELKSLAQQSPNAALDRIREISTAEEQQTALREVCLEISANDPMLALHAAWHSQLGKLGGLTEIAALEKLASRWAATDLEAALAWAGQLPLDEAGHRDRVMKGIASAWSQHAPADAAHLIAESMSPDYRQFDAAMKLVGQWAAVDFPAASAWVDLFPEGPVQDRGREELSKTMARNQILPNSP